MLNVTAVETSLTYDFTVTDGTAKNTFVYSYPKMIDSQPLDLQKYKNEALLLAQWEIGKNGIPIPVQL